MGRRKVYYILAISADSSGVGIKEDILSVDNMQTKWYYVYIKINEC